MTKQQKVDQFDAVSAELWRFRHMANCIANNHVSRPYVVQESKHGGYAGCSYAFRFGIAPNHSIYVEVTFRCMPTGQMHSVEVYDLDALKDSYREFPSGIWQRVAMDAINRWEYDTREEQRAA